MTSRTPNIWGDRNHRRVGLLGGSFNPAHDGHRHISLAALRALGLDEVWWLVAPQNPLKSTADMAGLADRYTRATAVADHPRLRVSIIEAYLARASPLTHWQRCAGAFPTRVSSG